MNQTELRELLGLSEREFKNALGMGLIIENQGSFVVVGNHQDIKLTLEKETLVSGEKGAEILRISLEDFLGFMRILMISPVEFEPDFYRRGDIEAAYELLEEFLEQDRAVSQYEIELAKTESIKILARIALLDQESRKTDALLYWMFMSEGHLVAYQQRLAMTKSEFLRQYYENMINKLNHLRSKAACELAAHPSSSVNLEFLDHSVRTVCQRCMEDFAYDDECSECVFDHGKSALLFKVKGSLIEFVFPIAYPEVLLWPGDFMPEPTAYWVPRENDQDALMPPGFDQAEWKKLLPKERALAARRFVGEKRNLSAIGQGHFGLREWVSLLPRSNKKTEKSTTTLAMRSLFPANKVLMMLEKSIAMHRSNDQ